MITKKIAKILRGSATPAQMMMACVLGSALGFMPGFAQSPGLILLLVLLLVVLNANLALAAMATAIAKILSLILLPLSFGLGRVLLDGPTQPLFKAMINAPVLALCGFEYYASTGGLLLGVVLGTIAGVLVIKAVQGIRTKIAQLEEGSERYRQWMAKWWVKLSIRILVGRGSKESYTALLEKKGQVIRPIGVVFSVLVVVLLIAAQMFFAGPFVTSALQRGLEQANGATVDLVEADVDLANGRMTITGLAMADPNALDHDIFRAATIEADVSATSLLRKQLKLDRVVISDAAHGAKRATPGRLVGNKPAPIKNVKTQEGEKTLEDYLQDPKRWQERLAQVRSWLEKLSGPGEKNAAGEEVSEGESLTERLKREAQAMGYARVAASHLITGAPRFTVTELLADNVRTSSLEGEMVRIRAANLSTHPGLLMESPSVAIESAADTLRLAIELGAVTAGGGENTVDFHRRGLPIDSIAGNIRADGAKPISGGTMDVALQGTMKTSGGTYIDLPLQITLHDTTITVGGNSAPIEGLTIPLGLRGPIDSPRIRIDDAKLADALVAAGAGALANEVRGRADQMIQDAVSDVDIKENLGGIDLNKGLGKLTGEDAKTQDNQNDKKAADDLGDKAKDLTRGLFGGKKKKDDG